MQHNKYLDNLRGYAACAVMMLHFSGVSRELMQQYPVLYLYSYLIPAHQAVILFFILSGFVLSQSIKNSSCGYINFIIRRVFRIYPLYFATILGLLALCFLSSNIAIDRYRGIDKAIPVIKDANFFANSILLIRSIFIPYVTNSSTARMVGFPLDIPMWTLSYEMMISLIFPVLYMIYSKRSFFLFVVYFIVHFVISLFVLQCCKDPLSYVLYYSIFFVIGILLADIKDILIVKFNHCLWILVASFCFMYPTNPFDYLLKSSEVLTDLLAAFGASLMIILCYSNNIFKKIIGVFSCFNIGRNSYSIYILHMPLSFFMFTFMIDVFNVNVSGIYSILHKLITITLVIICANLSYYFIEKPFIILGKKIAIKYF